MKLRALALCVASACLACGPSSTTTTKPGKPSLEVILIATERASGGGRLVGVRSDGARQYELTQLPSQETVIDRSPVVTPDGKSVIFVSNRGRGELGATSLWRVPVTGGVAEQLTRSQAIDRDPRVSPDGKWLYFCSNAAGSFDLYRAPLGASGLGEAKILVQSEDQIMSPSLSPDGSALVYMAVDASGHSRLWRSSSEGGSSTPLSEGPLDMTPAWGPNDEIAFAAPAVGRKDADLFVMPAAGGERRVLVDSALTDETGPRWSDDGRFVFAIGMYRSHSGDPLLGSVVFVDRQDKALTLRALHDDSTVESRIGLGLVPAPMPPGELSGNLPYAESLKKVMLQQVIRNQESERR